MYENGLAQQTYPPKVALLIDGENISSAQAGKIIVEAGKFGDLIVKRVYGNATMVKHWDTAPGIKLVHSGTGKNAADIVLALDAVELSYDTNIKVFALASSDGDFWHLATRLRERGFEVIGLGEEKAPACFQKSCSKWIKLTVPKVANDRAVSTVKSKTKKLPTVKLGTAEKAVDEVKPASFETNRPTNSSALSFDEEVLKIVRAHPCGITTLGINESHSCRRGRKNLGSRAEHMGFLF